MRRRLLCQVVTVSLTCLRAVDGRHVPGPALFPLRLGAADDGISKLRNGLDDAMSELLESSAPLSLDVGTESWAVQLTSSEETLWSSFSTAEMLAEGHHDQVVDGDTIFRIASISKTITAYALLLEKSMNLDDPITRHIPELMQRVDEPWLVDWDQVTLRSLGSFLSGMPRDTGGPCFVWRDVSDMGYNLTQYGLPTQETIKDKTCTSSDIIDRARIASRVFATNERPTYSNAAFSLLGIALEKASGLSFEKAITNSILGPLGMGNTTTKTPPKSKGIIPPISNDWATNLGADVATAGVYSTPNDISKYLRSILRAELLPRDIINAWLKPQSWTDSGTSSAYGFSWELLRTTRLTYNGRPLEIITKAGALHGYNSCIMLIPEFGLGLSVMVAGAVKTMEMIRETVVGTLIPSIESIARERAVLRYAGLYRYDDSKSDSYIRLDVDPNGPGLYILEWVSNGEDFLSLYGYLEGMPTQSGSWSAKLIPANISGSNTNLEMWRVVCVSNETDEDGKIFADLRLTDINNIEYGHQGLGDFVVVLDEQECAVEIFIQALGIRLQRNS